MSLVEAKPFVKYPGGKRELLPEIRKRYPSNERVATYVEPFVGGLVFECAESFSAATISAAEKGRDFKRKCRVRFRLRAHTRNRA